MMTSLNHHRLLNAPSQHGAGALSARKGDDDRDDGDKCVRIDDAQFDVWLVVGSVNVCLDVRVECLDGYTCTAHEMSVTLHTSHLTVTCDITIRVLTYCSICDPVTDTCRLHVVYV